MQNNLAQTKHGPEHQSDTNFSIATPAVTTILPIAGNLNDTSFLSPSYQSVDISSKDEQDETISGSHLSSCNDQASHNVHSLGTKLMNDDCSIGVPGISFDQSLGNSKIDVVDMNNGPENSSNLQEDGPKCKKRTKTIKKNGRLDARSKLEKSRQSARECRARKKLRYQYLEDLVSNREKAVVKLREELSMIDSGTVSEANRNLLIDQTNETIDNK